MKFIIAEVLREEVKVERLEIEKRSKLRIKKKVDEIFQKVYENRMNGEITIQTINSDVQKAFEDAGYIVTQNPAATMGDVSTTTIKW
jgi:hypothetical protein